MSPHLFILFIFYVTSSGYKSNLKSNHFQFKLKTLAQDVGLVSSKILETAEDSILHLRRSFVPFYQNRTAAMLSPPCKRPRIVLLGGGWSGHAFSKIIETDIYDVLCISPRPYFIFTPMLASASVGTVEYRSIVEPIRVSNPLAEYIEGEAFDINPNDKIIQVRSALKTDVVFEIPYDYLVYAVGSKVGDFGIPGVREHCYFLKEVDDVRKLKSKILDIFETVYLPDTSETEIRKLLTFVVVGGGPTGVEFIGELTDLIAEKIDSCYPRLTGLASIVLLNAGSGILTAFDAPLRESAYDNILARGVDVRLNVKVTGITESGISFESRENSDSGVVSGELPYGLCVWAAGNAPREISELLQYKLDASVTSSSTFKRTGRLEVDPWLRLRGVPELGSIFALGDCSVIRNEVVSGDLVLGEGILPQTAQVAGQQGAYVARLFNRGYQLAVPAGPRLSESKLKSSFWLKALGAEQADPFRFLNLGLLAYVGADQAVAQVQLGESTLALASGEAAFLLWRSVYLVKQVSTRTRLLVLFDFFKTKIFGKDLTGL